MGSIADAELMQGVDRERSDAQRLARNLELPSCDCDHAVGLEVIEVLAKSVGGVEVILAECEGAGRGRGPGINQSHLDDVILFGGVANEGASVRNVDVHLGAVVEMIGEICVMTAHDRISDDGIDLDTGDAGASVRNRAQNVYTAAGADDRVIAVWAKHVGDGSGRGHLVSLPR